MKLASARLIAPDIKSLVSFYEKVTGQTAEWLAPVFAEIVTPGRRLRSEARKRWRYSRKRRACCQSHRYHRVPGR